MEGGEGGVGGGSSEEGDSTGRKVIVEMCFFEWVDWVWVGCGRGALAESRSNVTM